MPVSVRVRHTPMKNFKRAINCSSVYMNSDSGLLDLGTILFNRLLCILLLWLGMREERKVLLLVRAMHFPGAYQAADLSAP